MTTLAGITQQQGDGIGTDGPSGVALALDRERAFFGGDIGSKVRQWMLAGQVFGIGGGDSQVGLTTIENNTAIDLTEPVFLIEIPSSISVVLINLVVSPAVVWETGDERVVYASGATGYSAGGDDLASTIQCMAVPGSGDSELGTTAVDAYDGDAAMTMAAVSNVRVLKADHALTGGLHLPFEYNILKGDLPVYVHGPAAIACMVARTTSTAEALITAQWAELNKNALVNS